MNEESNVQSKPHVMSFEFTGSGGEFFKIWIVNLVLTILTLGIYSAWAKVRTTRYFYGNTRLGDSSFEYLANPIAILKGRLIAVGLLLIYIIVGEMFPFVQGVLALALVIVTPWIVWRSLKFNARMSSYRNVRFGFYGSLKDAYKYLFLIPLFPILVAIIIGVAIWLLLGNLPGGALGYLTMLAIVGTYGLVPYIHKSIASYTVNNYRYGQGQMSADLSAAEYYKIYVTLLGITVLVFVVLGVVMALVAAITGIGPDVFQRPTDGVSSAPSMGLIFLSLLVAYVVSIVIGAFFRAYMQAKIRNYLFNQTRLDDVLNLQSDMTVGKLFRFYLVNILLMICTLGLAFPWIMVRIARFTAQATKASLSGSLDQYVTQQQENQSALGEEMGDAFDVDAAVDLAF